VSETVAVAVSVIVSVPVAVSVSDDTVGGNQGHSSVITLSEGHSPESKGLWFAGRRDVRDLSNRHQRISQMLRLVGAYAPPRSA